MARRHCVRFKRTASGRRCAKFAPGAAKRKRSMSGVKSPRAKGLSGAKGKSFVAELDGMVMRCVRFGRGPSRQIRCMRFAPGPGAPSQRARSAAGVKGKFRPRARPSAARRPARGRGRCPAGARRISVSPFGIRCQTPAGKFVRRVGAR